MSRRINELSPFRDFAVDAVARTKHHKNWCPVEITPENLREMWDNQNGKCAYTGIELHLPTHTTASRKAQPLNAASLDRIDNNRGYSLDNVHFVCKFINLGKGPRSDEETKEILENIYESYREKRESFVVRWLGDHMPKLRK